MTTNAAATARTADTDAATLRALADQLDRDTAAGDREAASDTNTTWLALLSEATTRWGNDWARTLLRSELERRTNR